MIKRILWALVDKCHVALAECYHGPELRRQAALINSKGRSGATKGQRPVVDMDLKPSKGSLDRRRQG